MNKLVLTIRFAGHIQELSRPNEVTPIDPSASNASLELVLGLRLAPAHMYVNFYGFPSGMLS